MKRYYKVFSEESAVRGAFITAFYDWDIFHKITPILMRHGLLGRHGLQTVDPHQWYPLQNWLDVLNDMTDAYSDVFGEMLSIGIRILDNNRFWIGSNTRDMVDVLKNWRHFYMQNHRGDVGTIEIIPGEGKRAEIKMHVPYPDEIMHGLLYALMQRYCPKDMNYSIQYENGQDGFTTFMISLYKMLESQPSTTQDDKFLHNVLLEFPISINQAILQNKKIEEQEIDLRVNGQSARAVISLNPSYGSDYRASGTVVKLQVKASKVEPNRQSDMMGNFSAYSPRMRQVIRQAQIASHGTAPVLIQGDSGTGKTFLAHNIHNSSEHRNKPFITLNCRTFKSQEALYSALCMACTQDGQEVNHGTLLLEDIEELSNLNQHLLLDVIETGIIPDPDTGQWRKANIRVMGTSVYDISKLVNQDSFLPPLYFRFNIFNFTMPLLNERVQDIPHLVRGLLDRIMQKYHFNAVINLTDDAMEMLKEYAWPGNVRELESVLEYAFTRCYDKTIGVYELLQVLQSEPMPRSHSYSQNTKAVNQVMSLADAERDAIISAGYACEGHINQMVDILGIGRTTLWRKLRELQISTDEFKFAD